MIRIDRADRDHAELLNPEQWVSGQWGGDRFLDCPGCHDCDPFHLDDAVRGCGGDGVVEDTRYGVSVCTDENDLVEYLAQVGGTDLDDAVLVELEGPYSDDEGHDAHLGEHLILPTKVLSVTPVGEEFAARVLARIDEIHGRW